MLSATEAANNRYYVAGKFEDHGISKDSNVSVIKSLYQNDFDKERLILHRQMFLNQVAIKNIKIQCSPDVVNYLKANP